MKFSTDHSQNLTIGRTRSLLAVTKEAINHRFNH
jgi:hypothetical protein